MARGIDMSKRLILTVLVCLGLVISAALGFVVARDSMQQAAQQAEAIRQAQEVAAQEKARLEKAFEDILNTMIRDVAEQVRAYKTERTVLGELVNPENLGDPSYVSENYALIQSLGPALRARMDSLMMIFETADNRVQTLLLEQPENIRAPVLAKWEEMKDRNMQPYIAYFSSEEEVLRAYEALMEFYYLKQNFFTVDTQSNALIFAKPEDADREAVLREALSLARAKQAGEAGR